MNMVFSFIGNMVAAKVIGTQVSSVALLAVFAISGLIIAGGILAGEIKNKKNVKKIEL